MKEQLARTTVACLLGMLIAAGAWAQGGSPGLPAPEAKSIETAFPQAPYSPYAGRNFPVRPFFGDTHLHTAFSMDAGAFGATLGPVDAYRFARGEEVVSSSGQRAKLSRPLDFLVVADHSDNMGFFPAMMSGNPTILKNSTGKRWYDMIRAGSGNKAAMEIIVAFSQGTFPTDIMFFPGTEGYGNAWKQTIDAAEQFNDPGRFTAFIGYEWTSNTGGNNLHRNVIFRDDASFARQVEPFTVYPPYGSDNPVHLWEWMQAFEDKTGGDVLAIAHNGNLSNGRMFPTVEAFGDRIDRDYMETRAKWERLYEVTQTKGTGEAHPFLSPNDEFSNFELWDKGNLDGSVAKTNEMLQYEYARAALKNGLMLEAKRGANPYKFGLIGSSDAHTGLSAMAEENFFGKTTPQEPSAERSSAVFVRNAATGVTIMDWEVSASGYAAVWATDNTREAIFDAMERREAYATTGTRMIVRFFGGWDFQDSDALSRHPAHRGYTGGVPMGGDLSDAPDGKSPTFLVAALKDPIGANLDRIQIVKGWMDSRGALHEKVYEVVWADAEKRAAGADGRVPPVGNTVDVANATWTNTIGAPELITVWKDPDFDPDERAFYYARVLEIPTPRWTAHDAKFFGTQPLDDATMFLQERGYTSPIWYTP